MDIAVVVNPAARAGARTPADRAVARLRGHGHVVTADCGTSTAETTSSIRAAAARGADAIVVVGGDGTVGLAAQELAGTRARLGIIPAGTGNDFSAHLGIPTGPEAAADLIDAGTTRVIDVARVTRADGTARVFVSVLASGFDAAVNDRANRMRWPRGGARYDIATLTEFLALKAYPYTLHVDGERIDGPFVVATVGNTSMYGGHVPICPGADPADGLLDVTAVRPRGRLRLLRLLRAVYRGEHVGRDGVVTLRGREIRLEAPGATAYADGDPVGALPLTAEVVPQALTLFVPPPQGQHGAV